jgi:hypothetical protein
MPEFDFIAKNDAGRKNLVAFARGLSAEDLRHPMEAGWTVSVVLAHVAFWDLRALTLIQKWQTEAVAPSPIDSDVVNEATRRLCLAIEGQAAVELACSAAESVDRAIAQLSHEMVKSIQTTTTNVRLERAAHRRLHIAEIQQALAKN